MRFPLITMLVIACSSKSPPPSTRPPPTPRPVTDASNVEIQPPLIDATAPPIAIDAAVTTPSITGCPAALASSHAGACTLGTDCPYKDGRCICDGYHGGIPPAEGRDYSHWVCGKTKARKDGCPDEIRDGVACKTAGKRCHPQEGMWCGPQFECAGGTWVSRVDTCTTIPRAPPGRD